MTIVNSPKMASSSRRIYSITVLTIVAVLILFITASLADITEIKKLVPGDGVYADYFGSSVSISGEYAIVGGTQRGCRGPECRGCLYFRALRKHLE